MTKKTRTINSDKHSFFYDFIDTPVGRLALIATDTHLHHILWEYETTSTTGKSMLEKLKRSTNNPILIKTKQQLSEYFDKKRRQFDIPLELHGTDFQKKAWQALAKIPYGETISYGEQASRLGDKNKARAVGLANGSNPISIIIPCHRVIGSNGKLTGFGGGLDNKSHLLELEHSQDQLL